MKMKVIFFLMLLCVAFSGPSLIAGIDQTETQMEVSREAEAIQAVATYYGVSTSAVELGTMFNNNGNDAWKFRVPSLNKKGTVTLTSSGAIVDDEAEGF